MQFEITLEVIGVKRQVVENRAFINVYAVEPMSPEQIASGCTGLNVKKISADEEAVAQLPAYKPHDKIKFLAVLKDAAGGKSAPHILGVVPAGKQSSTAA